MRISRIFSVAFVIMAFICTFVLFASASPPSISNIVKTEEPISVSNFVKSEKSSAAKFPPGITEIRDLTCVKAIEIRHLSYKRSEFPIIRFEKALLTPSTRIYIFRIPFSPPRSVICHPKDEAPQLNQDKLLAFEARRLKPEIVQLN